MSEKAEIGFGSSTISYTLEQLLAIKEMKEKYRGEMWPNVRLLCCGHIPGVLPKDMDELCAWVAVADMVDEKIKECESGKFKTDYITHLNAR